jgi:hypothetical protein
MSIFPFINFNLTFFFLSVCLFLIALFFFHTYNQKKNHQERQSIHKKKGKKKKHDISYMNMSERHTDKKKKNRL